MKPLNKTHAKPARLLKQHGVVLFFALIALLAMSLAAVALIRSVDTNTMIAGNLAFKQSATSSGDAGIEFAANWIQTRSAENAGLDVSTDATHPFNIDQPALGYYSSANSSVTLTDGTGIQWDDTDSVAVPDDVTTNKTRIVIQRLCRTAGVAAGAADCLYGSTASGGKQEDITKASEVCDGAGCDNNGQTIQYRITARSVAPRNSISYVQAFAY